MQLDSQRSHFCHEELAQVLTKVPTLGSKATRIQPRDGGSRAFRNHVQRCPGTARLFGGEPVAILAGHHFPLSLLEGFPGSLQDREMKSLGRVQSVEEQMCVLCKGGGASSMVQFMVGESHWRRVLV